MGFTLLFVTIFLIHLVLRNEIVVGKEKAKKKKEREISNLWHRIVIIMIGLLPPAHMDDSHLLHIHGSCEAYGYENFGLLVGFLFIGLLLVGLFLPNLALGSRRSPILTTSANLPVFPVRSHNFMTNYIHTLFITYSLYAFYQIL